MRMASTFENPLAAATTPMSRKVGLHQNRLPGEAGQTGLDSSECLRIGIETQELPMRSDRIQDRFGVPAPTQCRIDADGVGCRARPSIACVRRTGVCSMIRDSVPVSAASSGRHRFPGQAWHRRLCRCPVLPLLADSRSRPDLRCPETTMSSNNSAWRRNKAGITIRPWRSNSASL